MLRPVILALVLLAVAHAATPQTVSAQQCNAADTELSGALCYPKCDAGYYGVGPVCWKRCDAGYADHGATCYKSLLPPAFYAKHSYGRGAGTVPDWSRETGRVVTTAKQVGEAAVNAGRHLVLKAQSVDWCKVGTDLSRGVGDVLQAFGGLYQEFATAQGEFLGDFGVPREAYTVDYAKAAQILQPGLDNLIQPVIDATPNLENSLVAIREVALSLDRIPPDSLMKAACGDPNLRRVFEEGLLRLANSQGAHPAASPFRYVATGGAAAVSRPAAMPGWIGLALTFFDAGPPRVFGTPYGRPNMQHTFGFLVRTDGAQRLSYYSLSVGWMAGGGIGSSVRAVYIPFNVDRGVLLGHGWSASSTGLLPSIFPRTLAPLYSRRARAALTETMEVFGGFGPYLGLSLGPHVHLSNPSPDVTISYTHAWEINAGPPERH